MTTFVGKYSFLREKNSSLSKSGSYFKYVYELYEKLGKT